MKAPDKIYIHTKTNPLEITWSEARESNATNEEYVRKDALLEWAKGQIWEFPEDEFEWGINMAIGNVIEKINSL